jgi:hypothetical protein
MWEKTTQKIQTRIRNKITGDFSFIFLKWLICHLFRSLSITVWVGTACLENCA